MSENGLHSYSELAGERSNFYFFLSYMFLKPPLADTVGIIKKLAASSEISSFISDETEGLFRKLKNITESELEELVQEYHDLFKVPLSKYIAPYESVYRDGRMCGQSAIDVKRIYNKVGFKIPHDYSEFPDHIGIELAFMATLCREEKKAFKNNNTELILVLQDIEKNFLKEHLTIWFPELSSKIFEKTKNNFYLAIAKITLDFVLYDSNTLKNILV